MGNAQKLPEGKWLCPECNIVDMSKMVRLLYCYCAVKYIEAHHLLSLSSLSLSLGQGPLGSERRPFIGWFTINEVELPPEQPRHPPPGQEGQVPETVGMMPPHSVPLSGTSFHMQNQQQPFPAGAHPITSQPQQEHAHAMQSQVIQQQPTHEIEKDKCSISKDVEFLLASGKVFARYRASLEPFDPLTLARLPAKPTLKVPSPPLPLTARQIEELLKLLGPKALLALPWLRVPFNPQRLIAMANNGGTVSPNDWTLQNKSIDKLMTHQSEERQRLSNNLAQCNPTIYVNSYRRAPPVQMIKSHQGQLFCHLPDALHYPGKITNPLSVPNLDVTTERQYNVHIPRFDPIKPIRDEMIKMERSLNGACLLDVRWDVNENGLIKNDSECWKAKVERANSILKLSSLLVELIDATCLKAFDPHWYSAEERRSDHSNNNSNDSLITSDQWSPKLESTRRKWERCKGNEILRLFNGLEDALKSGLPENKNKRGKLRKSRESGANDRDVPATTNDKTLSNQTSSLSTPAKERINKVFTEGDIVSVQDRTCVLKPGGVAKIMHVHHANSSKDETATAMTTHYDVKYILGGMEKNVEACYVSEHSEYKSPQKVEAEESEQEPAESSRPRLKWEDRLKQLQDFKAKHGHVDVPRNYAKDPTLGKCNCHT